MPAAEVMYTKPISFADFPDGSIDDPAVTIKEGTTPTVCAAEQCTCGEEGCFQHDPLETVCSDWLKGIDLRNQAPVVVASLPGDTPAEDDDATTVSYDYAFHDITEDDDMVEWKWRWQERVDPTEGGTGKYALEVWYFDTRGLLRFYGKGAGDENNAKTPSAPFTTTYFGYDNLGRLALEISDFDLGNAETMSQSALYAGDEIPWMDVRAQLLPAGAPAGRNLITLSEFDDAGALRARTVGFSPDYLAGGSVWEESARTQYNTIAGRRITYTDTDDPQQHTRTAWQDDYIYQIEYQHVTGSSPKQVHGTTTVTVLDKGGRFKEQRIIARGAGGKELIDHEDNYFGWGTTLPQHTFNGWIEQEWDWVEDFPRALWRTPECRADPTDQSCYQGGPGGEPILHTGVAPDFPGVDNWPPTGDAQIVTLARTFKLYEQASTLKPTHDIVFRDFSEPPAGTNGSVDNDPRIVTRRYSYDLAEHIARQEEPDGSITRFLFDPKRRPTKVFKGADDACPEWFPPCENCPGPDDMYLAEHYLYNDGEYLCEHGTLPGVEGCTTGSNQEQFPRNAGKLVRARRFTDKAEFCGDEGGYNPNTASRDTQILYDWRGRAVVEKQLAVQHGGGTPSDPAFISATSTVYDNVNKPLLVATWAEGEVPSVAEIEAWSELSPELATSGAGGILTRDPGPLTLTRTLYDERGRGFEVRTYDVSDTTGMTYAFSRTYRDDLDRVVGELSASGLIVNKYDPLGRVVETSHWTKEDAESPGKPDQGDGVELTCTQTKYDAFGNVLVQAQYDRVRPNENTGPIPGKILDDVGGPWPPDLTTYYPPDQPQDPIVVTYAYNWYDSAKRLAATAYFGTAGEDGFSSGSVPFNYDSATPPKWNGTVYYFDQEENDLTGKALVTRYGYDGAGRRIWTQDGNGIVTRTWYDLLGRQLLVAENWKDFQHNSGPGGEDLTPDGHYDPPIRYTAYHYTRGGLMDMMAAMLPPEGSDPNSFEQPITPQDIDWNEQPGEDFAAGTTITFTGLNPAPTVQATRFLYDADVVAESNHDIPMSTAPNLVGKIEYPDAATGQPDPGDAVDFKYTVNGKLAQRTDQRGVTLDYFYGSDNSGPPDDILTEVSVSGTLPTDVGDHVTKLTFSHDDRGQLTLARSHAVTGDVRNRVSFAYDAFGNLTSETLQPSGNSDSARTTSYTWQWYAVHTENPTTNRLVRMDYPSGRTLSFGYGDDFTTAESAISRMTRVYEGSTHDIRHVHTGAGRTRSKKWGPDVSGTPIVSVDFTIDGESDPPHTDDYLPGTDRFGRVTNVTFKDKYGVVLRRHQYGYDADGNRLFDRIRRKTGAVTYGEDRSWYYGYDRLNRLTDAESGALNNGNTGFLDSLAVNGRHWQLDGLGNWSGSDDQHSVLDYSETKTEPGYQGSGTLVSYLHHDVHANNQIFQDYVDGTLNEAFTYDDAGNLTQVGNSADDRKYEYDAWGRVARVRRASDDELIALYYYDALGRRVWKYVEDTADYDTVYPGDYFYYDGNRVIEHHKHQVVEDPPWPPAM
ncbi:MAG: hypothetical protein PVI86_18030, partial [Phycisphaerae bacterium]